MAQYLKIVKTDHVFMLDLYVILLLVSSKFVAVFVPELSAI